MKYVCMYVSYMYIFFTSLIGCVCVCAVVNLKKLLCLRAHPHVCMILHVFEWFFFCCIRETTGVPAGTPKWL